MSGMPPAMILAFATPGTRPPGGDEEDLLDPFYLRVKVPVGRDPPLLSSPSCPKREGRRYVERR
jgi:hypothetical protein